MIRLGVGTIFIAAVGTVIFTAPEVGMIIGAALVAYGAGTVLCEWWRG
jgi:hypothetical protein